MLKRTALATVIALVCSAGLVRAQPSGVAIGVFVGGLPFDPPIRVTDTGVQMQFLVLCYPPADRTRKQTTVTVVDIPDGSSLATLRTLITDAFVSACGAVGVVVPRAGVLFPQFQFGL